MCVPRHGGQVALHGPRRQAFITDAAMQMQAQSLRVKRACSWLTGVGVTWLGVTAAPAALAAEAWEGIGQPDGRQMREPTRRGAGSTASVTKTEGRILEGLAS